MTIVNIGVMLSLIASRTYIMMVDGHVSYLNAPSKLDNIIL